MRAALTMTALGAIGCTHDPAAPLCPPLAAGDLVVTEIHTAPRDDAQGSWIELYDATGEPIDLHGIALKFKGLDGKGAQTVTVHRAVEVAPQAYVVLGLFADDHIPAHVDYGFGDDFIGSFPAAGQLEIASCTDPIDTVIYQSLPAQGTYSLGTMPPTASANDFPAMWCTDNPGTPRAANHACM